MRGRLAAGALIAAVAALVGCGSGTATGTPSGSPLSTADLQRLYEQAADAYNQAEIPVEQEESVHCTMGTGSPSLTQCEAALSQDRQATLSFDDAIRGLTFPDTAKADVAKLLADDAKLEAILEQAATAPSLSVIQDLSTQIFSDISAGTADAAAVRRDIGLPEATPPPSPSP